MTRVFNFSAGPAALPEPVLRRAAEEMLDWHGSGMSVMEMSHRGKEFISIAEQAESRLRELLAVPANYKVLFMQGGAIGENAIVPMNLLRGKKSIDFIDTGEWSKKSIKEARKYAAVSVAASSADTGYDRVPPRSAWKLDADAAYVHVCSNETIGGVQYHFTPEVGSVPLVADMSSDILSRPVDVSKYGLIYAGAQKNIGPAGLTIVIVRDDLLGQALPVCPSAFDFKTVAENDSMYNTPPTYAIYIAGLVFQWLADQGGLTAMAERNRTKAALLYDYLGTTSFYRSPVQADSRSLMNVPFKLKDESLDATFLKGARPAACCS
jgi:phosphoserine aminotransferase